MLEIILKPASLLFFWRRHHIRAGMALRRAQRFWSRDKRPKAIEFFERALSYGITDPRPYVQYASALLEIDDTDQAVNLLTDAVEVEPENAVPHIFLGIALSDAGDQTAARRAFRKALELSPQNINAATGLALAEARAGDFEKTAEKLLREGITDNLQLRARLLAAVEIYLRNSHVFHLPADLLPPAVLEPDDIEIPPRLAGPYCFKRGLKAFNEGRYKAALAYLLAAAERDHATDSTRLYAGGSLLALRRYTEAAEIFESFEESSPLYGAALFYAAVSRYQNDQREVARELLEKTADAGDVFDFEDVIHYYRGLCLLFDGQKTAAREQFCLALDIDWQLLPKRLADVLNASPAFTAASEKAEEPLP